MSWITSIDFMARLISRFAFISALLIAEVTMRPGISSNLFCVSNLNDALS